jgi:hypothetical protein
MPRAVFLRHAAAQHQNEYGIKNKSKGKMQKAKVKAKNYFRSDESNPSTNGGIQGRKTWFLGFILLPFDFCILPFDLFFYRGPLTCSSFEDF